MKTIRVSDERYALLKEIKEKYGCKMDKGLELLMAPVDFKSGPETYGYILEKLDELIKMLKPCEAAVT